MVKYNAETGELFNSKGKPLTEGGAEIPDSTPLAPPVGYEKRDTIAEQVRRMVQSQLLARDLAAAGAETFEDADDFDVGDDYDPTSPYEVNFDPTTLEELKRRRQEAESEESSPPPKPKKNKKSSDQDDAVTRSDSEGPKAENEE